MIGIYKITNPIGQIYIGQSIDVDRRLKTYKISLPKCQPKLYQSFLTHGFDNHTFEIIEECERLELNRCELKWIRFYTSLNHLNCSRGTEKDKFLLNKKQHSRMPVDNSELPGVKRYIIAQEKRWVKEEKRWLKNKKRVNARKHL